MKRRLILILAAIAVIATQWACRDEVPEAVTGYDPSIDGITVVPLEIADEPPTVSSESAPAVREPVIPAIPAVPPTAPGRPDPNFSR